jgi:hypothetical protein
MPRDSSGTYTASPSSPFVTGTPIAASTANTRASDVATEITDSLSRSGKGGMTAPLKFTGITATVQGGAADGATAVGVAVDTVNALSNAGAKLLSIRNGGTEKAYFDKNGTLQGGGTPTATAVSAFIGTWVNFGGTYKPSGYWKAGGIVHLEGSIKTGSLGTFAFNLPAGFRPAHDLLFGSSAAGSTWGVFIDTDGNVTPSRGDNTHFALNGISFRAEA